MECLVWVGVGMCRFDSYASGEVSVRMRTEIWTFMSHRLGIFSTRWMSPRLLESRSIEGILIRSIRTDLRSPFLLCLSQQHFPVFQVLLVCSLFFSQHSFALEQLLLSSLGLSTRFLGSTSRPPQNNYSHVRRWSLELRGSGRAPS